MKLTKNELSWNQPKGQTHHQHHDPGDTAWMFLVQLSTRTLNQTLTTIRNNIRNLMSVITETRITGHTARVIAPNLAFGGFYCTDSTNFRGGIWILWDANLVAMEIFSSTEQEILAEVWTSPHSSYLLSAIYASPRWMEKEVLWNNLRSISDAITHPWLLVGDFNSIVDGSEKIDGNPATNSQTRSFTDYLDYCLL